MGGVCTNYQYITNALGSGQSDGILHFLAHFSYYKNATDCQISTGVDRWICLVLSVSPGRGGGPPWPEPSLGLG